MVDEQVLNNYSNIFTLITRMRQMADHPDLVIKCAPHLPRPRVMNAALTLRFLQVQDG